MINKFKNYFIQIKCTKNVRQKSFIFGGAFFMSKYRVIFLVMI